MAYRSNLLNSNISPESLARGLGWFSIGLGLSELFMTRKISRAAGLPGKEGVLRVYGAREIGQGVGILASKHANTLSPWIWLRVAGDALDIATAATGLRTGNPRKGRAVLTLLALAGVTMVDAVCATELNAKSKRQARRLNTRDYSDRSGFPEPPEQMRGVARDSATQRVPRKPEPAQPRLSS
jgi:hypothetical protein